MMVALENYYSSHTLQHSGISLFRRWALFDDLEYASQLLQPNTGLGTNTNATGAPFLFSILCFLSQFTRTHTVAPNFSDWTFIGEKEKKKILAKISKNILLSLHFTIRSYHGPPLITVHTVSVIILFRKYTAYRGKKRLCKRNLQNSRQKTPSEWQFFDSSHYGTTTSPSSVEPCRVAARI